VLAGLAPRLHSAGGWRFSHFRIGTELESNPFLGLSRALVPLYVASDSNTERLRNTRQLAASLQTEFAWADRALRKPRVGFSYSPDHARKGKLNLEITSR
jgi:hypothetical protein